MADNTTQTKLEEQIRAACRLRHYSLATERTYVRWYKQFVRWCGMKHPATLGGDRVEAWLSHLATEREVSASTQRQALAAILFLYRQVLGMQTMRIRNSALSGADLRQFRRVSSRATGVQMRCAKSMGCTCMPHAPRAPLCRGRRLPYGCTAAASSRCRAAHSR